MMPFTLRGSSPFPVAETHEALPSELYRAALATWPAMAAGNLEPGDERFEAAIAGEPWRSVFSHLNSQAQAVSLLSLFTPFMDGCAVAPEDMVFGDGYESRDTRHAVASLISERPAREVFPRTHFQAGRTGYHKGAHVDWPRRVYSCMVFFCDADEAGLEGGEFATYYPDGSLWETFEPRHNRAVCWLNTRQSFHEGRSIQACRGERRWLFHVLTSEQDLWA